MKDYAYAKHFGEDYSYYMEAFLGLASHSVHFQDIERWQELKRWVHDQENILQAMGLYETWIIKYYGRNDV